MLPVPPLLSLWCHPSVEHSHALSVKSLEGHTPSGWCFPLPSFCTHWPANIMWCSNFKPLQHRTTQNVFQNFIRQLRLLLSEKMCEKKERKKNNRKRGARQVDREKKRQPERGRRDRPSKHSRSDLHLIQIGSEVLARNGCNDSCTPGCLQPKSDTVSQN